MRVTSTEFRRNVGKYLDLSQHDDILISKHGVTVAKLCKVTEADKLNLVDSLVGVAEGLQTDEAQLREERLRRQ